MRESNQALFNTEEILVVDQEMIAYLKKRALDEPAGRFRLCLHRSPDDVVQEMVVVHCRENYSRPHYHPDTASSMMILEGEVMVFFFDDDGNKTRTVELGARESGKPFTLWLAPNVWHMPVCRSEQLVFHETMQGPFRREAVNAWAPWSPAEDDEKGIARYLKSLGVD